MPEAGYRHYDTGIHVVGVGVIVEWEEVPFVPMQQNIKKEGEKMRKIVVAMVMLAMCLVLLTGLLPVIGDCADTKSKLDLLYEAAKAEGKVVWWDPTKA